MLMATADVLIELDPAAPRTLTSGKHYVVVSMHPISSPAKIKVIDDQGQLHRLAAEHVRLWFKRAVPVSGVA